MTVPRQSSGATLTRLLAPVAAGLAAGAGLFFIYARYFSQHKLRSPLTSPRVMEDALVLAVLVLLIAVFFLVRPRVVAVPAPRARRLDWRVAVPLCALILAAAFLRIHDLGLQSLWYDELSTTYRISGPTLADAVQPGGRVLDSWPSFHIPMFLFVQLAGTSEFALRLPSALAGVAAVPVIFVIGRRMFSDLEGLLAASLSVALQGAIWYSQEVRMYGPLMLLAGVSGYCWFRIALGLYQRRSPPPMMTLGYAATLIAMIYMHHYGLMLAGIEGLATLGVMASARRWSPAFIVAFAAAGLAYLPWLPMFYSDLHNKTFFAANLPGSLLRMLDEFAAFLAGEEPQAFLIAGLCALGLGFAVWRAARSRGGQTPPLAISPLVVLATWLALPLLIAYFRSLVATPIVQYRYFLVTLPPVAVLAARALTRLPIRRAGYALVGVAVPVGLTAFLFLSGFYSEPRVTQVRETVDYIVTHDAQYPDSVIAASMLGTPQQVHYYFLHFDSPRTIDLKLSPPNYVDSNKRILAANTRYVWLIGEDYNFDAHLLDLLNAEYRQVDKQRFYNMTLWLYERKSAAANP